MTQNINQQQFWDSGAFLRLPTGEFLVLEGPFVSATEATADFGRMDFFGNSEEWWTAAKTYRLQRQELAQLLEPQLQARSLQRAQFRGPHQDSFESSFRTIQGKIQRGEIEKAVPMVAATAEQVPSAADLAHSIFNLLGLPTNLNIFGFWQKGHGLIGATPEILFDLTGTTLRTMALAGSCPKADAGQRVSLLKDPKEMKEHQLVVDDLALKLRPLGWLRQDRTTTVELPTIIHLLTQFELSGVSKTPRELMRYLHPTAAMGVAPRAYGYQWMKELPDQKERGYFGAPIVFKTGPTDARCVVAIRSLFWNEKSTSVFAGCGIVAASVFEREWSELNAKIDSVYRMMGLEVSG